MLIIGRDSLECTSFRLKGGYGKTIARLFSLPVAVESTEPLTLDIVLKYEFYPKKSKRPIYWDRTYIGYFLIASAEKEWNGDSYRTRLELKQCDRPDEPDDPIPLYKWRHDLLALSQGLPETDGAIVAAGRIVDPFANSWKLGSETVDNEATERPEAPPLSIRLGGTGERDPKLALLRLGGISSDSKGVPFGVAPLGADGKVPLQYLPPLGGGGGGTVIYPIAIALGGTNADNSTQARQNLGAASLADVNSAINSAVPPLVASLIPPIPPSIPPSAIGAASGVAPLGTDSKVPATNLPAYPTLASLNAVSVSAFNTAVGSLIPLSAIGAASGVAPLGTDSKVPATNLPAFPTLTSLNGVNSNLIGVANGIVPLNNDVKISAGYFPINVAYLNFVQTFTTLQTFTSGIAVRGGSPPPITTGTYQTVDANGLPRLWLVNASANINNRIKSITVANNGNVQIRHHNDDLSDGNVLEHTASGNVLTNGTLRPGGGNANFSGASFLPGALYYRSDLTMLTYSDGTSWRRMDNNAVV